VQKYRAVALSRHRPICVSKGGTLKDTADAALSDDFFYKCNADKAFSDDFFTKYSWCVKWSFKVMKYLMPMKI
jgi:hypothetical protein